MPLFENSLFALFDQELFLSDEQRQKMLDLFSGEKKKITSPFYSFVGQTYYLPYQSIREILTRRKADFLDERQKRTAAGSDIRNTGNGNQNYIMFQAH